MPATTQTLGTKTDHGRLRQKIVEKLLADVFRGRLSAGRHLVTQELADRFKVSHTPIREALKQLEVEGLVEHVPYRGVRVVEFSIDDVEDIYAMRTVLESLAARSAAACLTDDELAEIRHYHEAMMAIADPTAGTNLQAIRELNRQFHLAIIQGSHRTHLIRTLEQMWSWFPTMLWSQFALAADTATPQRAGADNRDHGQIVAALAAHDPEAAAEAMRTHIEQTKLALEYHLKFDPKPTLEL